MNELQTLNIQTEKMEITDEYLKESRKMIRKLIFIFARCARLFEFLRQSTKDQSPPTKEEEIDSKKESSKKFTIRNLLSKVGFGEQTKIPSDTDSPKVSSPLPMSDAIEVIKIKKKKF